MPKQKTHLHNLPAHFLSFVGRESEIVEIIHLLQATDCRLLTLVGTGGVGKTRLAIEAIHCMAEEDYQHGIYYVPLALLTSAQEIVTLIIEVLGILIGDDGTPQEELVKFLSQKHLLLVLDNFEHVLDGVDLVTHILHDTSYVKILTTSREPLNLSLEHIWHVKGLPYPDTESLDEAQIEHYSALKLFRDRAIQVQRNTPHDEDDHSMIQICRLVDGLPLAIELATSWIHTLSYQDILTHIEAGIDILSTRRRDIAPRHHSIRAVFDHSWDLLTPDEQAVFPCLSVFRGGFTRDAAEKVADASLNTLSGLVEKSMVRHNNGRYDLHELVRQYGEEKLNDTGNKAHIQEKHMHYYADFMDARREDIKGKRQLESLDEIHTDFDNLRLAWNRAISESQLDTLQKMMETLALFCHMRTFYQVGESLFKYAIEILIPTHKTDLDLTLNRLRIRYVQVWVLPQLYPVPPHILKMVDDSQQVAEQQDDWEVIMLCCWLRGICLGFTGSLEKAVQDLEYGERLAVQHQAFYYQGRILRVLDNLFTIQYYEDTPYAIDINNRFKLVAQQISDLHGLADAINIRSNRYLRQSKYTKAESNLCESKQLWEQIGDQKAVGVTTMTIAIHQFFRGKLNESEENLLEAFNILASVNFVISFPIIYAFLSMIASLSDEYGKAREFAHKTQDNNVHVNGSVAKFFTYAGLSFYSISTSDYLHAVKHLSHLLEYTQHIPLLETIALVVSTFVFNHQQEFTRSAEYQGLAFTHPASRTGWMERWNNLAELQTELQAKLGIKAYQKAWELGASLQLDAVIATLQAEFNPDQTSDQVEIANQSLIEPLTPRELEILQLINSGFSNRDIAEHLVVVEDTVKKHLTNLYGKLSVKRRTQAIAKARELKLL